MRRPTVCVECQHHEIDKNEMFRCQLHKNPVHGQRSFISGRLTHPDAERFKRCEQVNTNGECREWEPLK